MTAVAAKVMDFHLDKILEEYMLSQLTKNKFNPRELRVSENGGCARKRVMRVLGYKETHPLTLADAKNFEKGRAIELWLTNILEELYPGEIKREVTVEHPYGEPIGEGHIDIEWPAKKMLVEIKAVSKEKADYGLPVLGHVNQLMSYLHFKKGKGGVRQYDQGQIIYLIIGRYGITPVSYPVFYTREKGEALEAEMKNLWTNYVLKEEIPYVPEDAYYKEFPCYWEDRDSDQDVIPHFCQFHGHCWDESSFLDDSPKELDDEANIELFDSYEKTRSMLKALDNEVVKVKEKKGELEAQLTRLFNLHAGEKKLQVEDVTISRARIKGRVTFSITNALECGVVSEQSLAPFRNKSPGYDRFTARRLEKK